MISISKEKEYELKNGKKMYVKSTCIYQDEFYSCVKYIFSNDILYSCYEYRHGKKVHIERCSTEHSGERKKLVDYFLG